MEQDEELNKYRICANGTFYARNIDDALKRLSKHFDDVDNDELLVEGKIEIFPESDKPKPPKEPPIGTVNVGLDKGKITRRRVNKGM